MSAALTIAHGRRRAVAEIKRDLQSGKLSLADLVTGPHELAENVPLVDLVRWGRRGGRKGSASLEWIGREAMAAGVNLMLTAGRANVLSRAWVAENGERGMHRHGRR